jgi:hypothetical protein
MKLNHFFIKRAHFLFESLVHYVLVLCIQTNYFTNAYNDRPIIIIELG